MSEMEEKLGAILNNPEMMKNIMAMAQTLGQTPGSGQSEATEKQALFPDIDISMLQKIGSFAGQANIDPQQKDLLSALSPFLTNHRIAKLEKAMRAAKMAKLTSVFLNSGGPKPLSGR